jgi:hypothetical protein
MCGQAAQQREGVLREQEAQARAREAALKERETAALMRVAAAEEAAQRVRVGPLLLLLPSLSSD